MAVHTLADLELAARHVVEGEARVARMEALLAKRRELGLGGTILAESVLKTMLECLSIMREHKAQIEAGCIADALVLKERDAPRRRPT
jgi:hypothetical protein